LTTSFHELVLGLGISISE